MNFENLELNNFFCCVLLFGNAQVMKLVIAEDHKDAMETIKKEYDLAKVVSILSIQEMLKMAEDTNNSPTDIHVIQISNDNDDFSINHIVEKDLSINEIKQKYSNQTILPLNNEQIISNLNLMFSWIQDNSEIPLISKKMSL